MKAKIIDIKRFAVHDGDGIRTTIFFKGCPLKCVWCHNPEGIENKPQLACHQNKCLGCGECVNACPQSAHQIIDGVHFFNREKCLACGRCENVCLGKALKFYGKEYTVDELLEIVLKDVEFYNSSGGGVTLSGGECLVQWEFCFELLKKLKEKGINTAVDTCGYVSKEILEKVMPYTDVFLYDIKAIDEDVHIKCTGKSNEIILENLKFLDDNGAKIEIRYPFVPNYNDDQVDKIYNFIKGLKNVQKVKVLTYHNFAGSKYESIGLKNTMPKVIPSEERINKIQTRFDFISK